MKIYEKKPKEEAVISFKEILRAALELPPVQRAMLADLLLESLDGPDQMEIDDAWSREAERRMEEIRTGKVETIDGELVMEELSSEEQKRIDDLWAQEAERRDQEIEDGTVVPVPGEEVLSRLRARHKR